MGSKRTVWTVAVAGVLLLVIIAAKFRSSETLARRLSSENGDTVRNALYLLEERRDPAGKDQARKLLLSDDDYIWFNAALYLGAIGDGASIPYLIKGLKHPASRAYDDVAACLELLTTQKFGKDQKKWINWWKETNSDSDFDFVYHKLREEALALTSDVQLLINGVADPVRIRHCGPQIRLIGVKLRENADREKVLLFLKRAVVNQVVQLEFDTGDQLDEEGARRALVYWLREDTQALTRSTREGLPPVPFREKTLINLYLLRSGLYELDLDGVNDPRVRKLLQSPAYEAGPASGVDTDGQE